MRIKPLIAAAAMLTAMAATPQPAMAGWWPWYSPFGYDSAFGYYGSPAAGPMDFYVPPKPRFIGTACVPRRVWIARHWQSVCS